MDIKEELKSAGVYPSGPVSAWPQERHNKLTEELTRLNPESVVTPTTKVKASASKMAKGLIKTAGQAMRHGKVSAEVRKERYDTCKACPAFIKESKRCSDCGCFMEAKTWVGGNPDTLCPQKKWSR